jgi:K+-transporting ATPase ATPase A chain
MARVYQGQRTFLSPVLRPVERLVYWLTGVREDQEQGWVAFMVSALALGGVTLVLTFVLLRLQDRLGAGPGRLPRAQAAGGAGGGYAAH